MWSLTLSLKGLVSQISNVEEFLVFAASRVFFFFCFSLFKAIALKFSVTVVSISIVMFSLYHMSNVGNR